MVQLRLPVAFYVRQRPQPVTFLVRQCGGAEWHWAKMANGILYECEIQEHSRLHRGDMRLIDLAGSELSSGQDPVPHAQKYWAGEGTGEPIWELLVTSATVTAVISDNQNLRRERLLHGQRLPWPRTGVDVANTEPGITGIPEEH